MKIREVGISDFPKIYALVMEKGRLESVVVRG